MLHLFMVYAQFYKTIQRLLYMLKMLIPSSWLTVWQLCVEIGSELEY